MLPLNRKELGALQLQDAISLICMSTHFISVESPRSLCWCPTSCLQGQAQCDDITLFNEAMLF